jgi:hypothetical protein
MFVRLGWKNQTLKFITKISKLWTKKFYNIGLKWQYYKTFTTVIYICS